MRTRDDLKTLLESHWTQGWPLHIDFGDGWIKIAFNGIEEMIKTDPNIKLEQVKEKFGVMRIYYSTGKPNLEKKLRAITDKLEKQSAETCELTGRPGMLMRRLGSYKTLNADFINEGWTPIQNGPITTFITQY